MKNGVVSSGMLRCVALVRHNSECVLIGDNHQTLTVMKKSADKYLNDALTSVYTPVT
jgi:carbamoylphosphate synthase large subunit